MRRESISKNSSSLYFATQIGKFLYFTDVITTGCNLYICSCIYLLSLVFAGLMLQSNPENHEHLPLMYIFSHVNTVKSNEVQNETKNRDLPVTATKLRVINILGVCCGKVLQFASDCSTTSIPEIVSCVHGTPGLTISPICLSIVAKSLFFVWMSRQR